MTKGKGHGRGLKRKGEKAVEGSVRRMSSQHKAHALPAPEHCLLLKHTFTYYSVHSIHSIE